MKADGRRNRFVTDDSKTITNLETELKRRSRDIMYIISPKFIWFVQVGSRFPVDCKSNRG